MGDTGGTLMGRVVLTVALIVAVIAFCLAGYASLMAVGNKNDVSDLRAKQDNMSSQLTTIQNQMKGESAAPPAAPAPSPPTD